MIEISLKMLVNFYQQEFTYIKYMYIDILKRT